MGSTGLLTLRIPMLPVFRCRMPSICDGLAAPDHATPCIFALPELSGLSGISIRRSGTQPSKSWQNSFHSSQGNPLQSYQYQYGSEKDQKPGWVQLQEALFTVDASQATRVTAFFQSGAEEYPKGALGRNWMGFE